MKHELTLANIKSFSLDKKPVGVDSAGRIIYQPNPRGVSWSSFFVHADQAVGLCTGGQLGGRAGQHFILCG